jgi:hypothetical protein
MGAGRCREVEKELKKKYEKFIVFWTWHREKHRLLRN